MTSKAKKKITDSVARSMWKQFTFEMWNGFEDNFPEEATAAEKQEVARGVLIELRKMIDKKLNQGG